MENLLEKLNKYAIEFDADKHEYFHEKKELFSVTRLLGTLEPEFDEQAMAIRCSQNPNHELFGIEPEKIILKWREKNRKACDRGHAIHSFIESVLLEDKERYKQEIQNPDLPYPIRVHFLKFWQEQLKNHHFQALAVEQRLASPSLGICGTLDTFLNFPAFGNFVFDWKTNASFHTHSDFFLLAPFDKFDKSSLTLYTLQTQIYRFLLETEYDLQVDGSRIVWLNEVAGVVSHKPKFAYDRELVKDVIAVGTERLRIKKQAHLTAA